MSPSRFLPLRPQHAAAAAPPAVWPAPTTGLRPGQGPGSSGSRGQRAPRRRPAAAAAAIPDPPYLALSVTLAPGQADLLVGAVLARALRPGHSLPTLILDLHPAGQADPAYCAALGSIRDALRGAGVRLLVAVSSRQAREEFAAAGLAGSLSAGALHPSLRSAALSVYATLPGPGVVTTAMRKALTTPAEPLIPGASAAGRSEAASPAEDGAAAPASWWTEGRQAERTPPGSHRMGERDYG